MVTKILSYLGRRIPGLHDAAYLLAFFALLSQILALVRDRLLAFSFGAGTTLDIYYASFRVPDLIYASIASMVSISVLVPFLASRMEDSNSSAKNFVNNIFTVFFVAITTVVLVVFALAEPIINLVYPGFGVEESKQVVLLTRILLLSPFLLGLSNLLAGVTQTFQQFFVYALSPLLYNVGIIFGILFLYPPMGIAGLGLGVVIGALLHLLIQVPTVSASGFIPRFKKKPNMKEIKRVALTSLPRTLALSANQLALLFLVSLASLMAVGSISIFNFSFNLQSVPLSIIGVSYSLAAFPALSKLYSSGQMKEFFEQVTAATRYIIFWSTPAIVLFVILRAQIVRTVLGAGEFSWSDTRLTAAAVALFVISLIGQSLNQLFIRGYYAAGNTIKPLVVNLISSSTIVVSAFFLIKLFDSNQFFKYFLESLFRVDHLPGTTILVLPMAYSIGLTLNGLLFWILFQRDFRYFSASIYKTVLHSVAASVIMGTTAYLALVYFGSIFDLSTFIGVFTQGLLSGLIGIVAGIVMLYSLDNGEMKEVWEALHHKFWRTSAVLPDSNEL